MHQVFRGRFSDTKVVVSIPASSGVSVLVWGYDAPNSSQSYIFGIRTCRIGDLAACEVTAVTCCDWLKANKQTNVHYPSDGDLKGQSDNTLN